MRSPQSILVLLAEWRTAGRKIELFGYLNPPHASTLIATVGRAGKSMKPTAITALALGLMSIALRPADAAEIKVLSLPGMMTVLEELGPHFERTSGHKLATSFVVPGPMLRRIDAGEKFDVVII